MPWIVMLIFGLILASMIAGQSSAPSTTVGGKDCTGCKADFDWYASLGRWEQAAKLGWYVGRKIACALNGC